MLYKDGNGFPVTLKPSHLFGSTERMDVAEVLSSIVEQACLYTSEVPVAVTNVKKPKRPFKEVDPKEAFSEVDTVPMEALTSVEKVSVASSNFVRFT